MSKIFFMNSILEAILRTVLSLIFCIICARNSSKIAYKKNRNPQTWFMLGLFFGLIPLIIIYFLKPLKNIKKPQRVSKVELPKHFTILQTDNNYWYYLDSKRKQIGPMSLKALYSDYLKEKISNTTYVWNDTMDNWKKLIEISVLNKILKQSTS